MFFSLHSGRTWKVEEKVDLKCLRNDQLWIVPRIDALKNLFKKLQKWSIMDFGKYWCTATHMLKWSSMVSVDRHSFFIIVYHCHHHCHGHPHHCHPSASWSSTLEYGPCPSMIHQPPHPHTHLLLNVAIVNRTMYDHAPIQDDDTCKIWR